VQTPAGRLMSSRWLDDRSHTGQSCLPGTRIKAAGGDAARQGQSVFCAVRKFYSRFDACDRHTNARNGLLLQLPSRCTKNNNGQITAGVEGCSAFYHRHSHLQHITAATILLLHGKVPTY